MTTLQGLGLTIEKINTYMTEIFGEFSASKVRVRSSDEETRIFVEGWLNGEEVDFELSPEEMKNV
jgi:hypothetical protein